MSHSLTPPPLIERLPRQALPGALSISNYSLRNGASLLSTQPLSIEMSQQRWANSVLFPIDCAALSSRAAPCVVRAKLIVEGGMVGVTGCDSKGKIITGPEAVVSGTAEVQLTLSRPAETRVIVIRNVEGPKSVRVTILEISVFEPGEERLASRRHDLGYDLFVVLSPPKTGTHTIEEAVKSLSPFVRIYRVHCASPQGSMELRRVARLAAAAMGAEDEAIKSLNLQADTADIVRAEVATIRRLGGRVAFLSAVREPIGRAVARMFGSATVPVYLHLYASGGPVFAEMLASGQVAAWKRELKETSTHLNGPTFWTRCLVDADYINDEFRIATGFDLRAREFKVRRGYARLDQDNDVALIFRTSALERSLSSALAEITGRPLDRLKNHNVAAKKEYGPLYNDVLSRIRMPSQLSEAIYRRHAYMTHFFDQTEIDDLVRRWSGLRVAQRVSA